MSRQSTKLNNASTGSSSWKGLLPNPWVQQGVAQPQQYYSSRSKHPSSRPSMSTRAGLLPNSRLQPNAVNKTRPRTTTSARWLSSSSSLVSSLKTPTGQSVGTGKSYDREIQRKCGYGSRKKAWKNIKVVKGDGDHASSSSESEYWAGPSYIKPSPAPSSLPIPKFLLKAPKHASCADAFELDILSVTKFLSFRFFASGDHVLAEFIFVILVFRLQFLLNEST
ncbi:hypothetical protein Dimus_002184 [Dionaea muscipula]